MSSASARGGTTKLVDDESGGRKPVSAAAAAERRRADGLEAAIRCEVLSARLQLLGAAARHQHGVDRAFPRV